jgi:hypothetical protein
MTEYRDLVTTTRPVPVTWHAGMARLRERASAGRPT